jgi:hypothetical protein
MDSSYSDFLVTHRPIFPEATDCLEVDNWLRMMESKFGVLHVDVSYAAPQAHGIGNVPLHREYSPSIVFIFSQERNDLYHV